jgi:hypothetical protein
MAEGQEPLREVSEDQMEVLRRCRFVQRRFTPYPSLRSVEPEAWDEEQGYHSEAPYTGQEYDPSKFELVEGGWDHEHCSVCWAKIEAGDSYWANDGSDQVALCPACFEWLRGQLRA